jgi:hypothetical protein
MFSGHSPGGAGPVGHASEHFLRALWVIINSEIKLDGTVLAKAISDRLVSRQEFSQGGAADSTGIFHIPDAGWSNQ